MLVLQTVLPALWFADGSSRVEVHGGRIIRPRPAPILFAASGSRCWRGWHQPAYHADNTALSGRRRRGGDGCRKLAASLRGSTLISRGEMRRTTAKLCWRRFLTTLANVKSQRWKPRRRRKRRCAGRRLRPLNALSLMIQSENLTELFAAFGVKGTSAQEAVANQVAHARRYLASPAAVRESIWPPVDGRWRWRAKARLPWRGPAHLPPILRW